MTKEKSVLLFCVLFVLISVMAIGYTQLLARNDALIILYSLSMTQLLTGGIYYVWLRGVAVFIPRHKGMKGGVAKRKVEWIIGILALSLIISCTAILTITGSPVSVSWQQLVWLMAYQLVLIGLAEEVLFRGLVFEAFPKSASGAFFTSCFLFSLFHWNNGIETLPYYFSLGAVFAVFRQFGFSLISLAIGHAIFNLVFQVVLPTTDFRFGHGAFYFVMPFALLCVAALSGWLLSAVRENIK